MTQISMSRSPPEGKLASVLSSVDLYFYLVLSCSERDTDPLSKTFLEHNLKKKKINLILPVPYYA